MSSILIAVNAFETHFLGQEFQDLGFGFIGSLGFGV